MKAATYLYLYYIRFKLMIIAILIGSTFKICLKHYLLSKKKERKIANQNVIDDININ